MATRGPRPGPLLQRFAHLRAEKAPSVYLIEFSNGVVKVGYSKDPAFRMVGLLREWLPQSVDILRVCVRPGGRQAERACIAALTKAAVPLAGRLEYFTGITYEAAQSLIEA